MTPHLCAGAQPQCSRGYLKEHDRLRGFPVPVHYFAVASHNNRHGIERINDRIPAKKKPGRCGLRHGCANQSSGALPRRRWHQRLHLTADPAPNIQDHSN